MVFKREWVKYYDTTPTNKNTFVFIDPAMSESDGADYTGVVVVHVDSNNRWFVEVAQHRRIRPTDIIELMFTLYDQFSPSVIGIEDIAFQKAIVHFAHEEMRRRNKIIPLMGVNPGVDKTKEMRILGLVPRFEWGNIFLNRGLTDLEDELFKFPRSKHDDICDALSSIGLIAYAPKEEKPRDARPNPSNAAEYERWYRSQLSRGKNPRESSKNNEPY
jgi:predicted phage terminase large subunit-like protein